MLKYSTKNLGEFVAVDNFNGGATRSIKTLSGGERFIFSLGLALGVSQSIAVNNNKAFNFFFIDEGFGNLSDDYIDDVLNCFDTLIKLDAVGRLESNTLLIIESFSVLDPVLSMKYLVPYILTV
jgi:exonuclease SbcC